MKPVSSKDIPTSTATVTQAGLGTSSQMVQTVITSNTDSDSATVLDSEIVNEEEILEEGNNEGETLSEVFQILDNMENGQIDKSLPRTSAEDVAFDMDEVIIEEDDYYTDGTTDSEDDSDVSLKDSLEDIKV